MTTRGPVPKRAAERRRRNKASKPEVIKAKGSVAAPKADLTWHPIALGWFRSLATSGQARYFEPSDWQAARLVAEAMSKNLKAGRFSAQLFAAVWQAMGELLTTEGARRRARLEIERAQTEVPEGVPVLEEYRKAFGK